MATEATADEARGGEDAVHRLRDIVVEEVSLVDRAANKRRFLVVKRSDMATNGEAADGQAGTAGRVEKAARRARAAAPEDAEKARRRAAAADDEVADAEKARRSTAETADDEDEAQEDRDDARKARRRPAPATEDDDPEDAEKADGDDDEDEDDEEEAAAQKARTPPPWARDRAAAAGQDDEDDEASAEKPAARRPRRKHAAVAGDARTALLRGLTTGLERLMKVAGDVKDGAALGSDGGLPPDAAREVGAVAALLGALAGAPAVSAKADVAKAGARMAKERLDRFQKAVALLQEVLSEIGAARDDGAAVPARTPADLLAKRATPVTAAPTVPGLDALVAGIGELTRLVKRHEDEFARLRATRGVSNAIAVEGGARRAAEPQEVSWPLDMNKPISRDSVAKAVSFFDE